MCGLFIFYFDGSDMKVFVYQPPKLPWLDIRYQDEHIVIINKPSGLLSNPGIAEHTHDCAVTRLQKIFPVIHLVHRLDCDTSGVMVFARTKAAERHLKKQFEGRDTQKTYVALVSGVVTEDDGVIEANLLGDKQNPPLQKVDTLGKIAITHYEVMARYQQQTRLRLKPVTGRTHQLRVHLQHIGHTILGDTFYGDEAQILASPRLCLHAQTLTFAHPDSQQLVSFNVACGF